MAIAWSHKLAHISSIRQIHEIFPPHLVSLSHLADFRPDVPFASATEEYAFSAAYDTCQFIAHACFLSLVLHPPEVHRSGIGGGEICTTVERIDVILKGAAARLGI